MCVCVCVCVMEREWVEHGVQIVFCHGLTHAGCHCSTWLGTGTRTSRVRPAMIILGCKNSNPHVSLTFNLSEELANYTH